MLTCYLKISWDLKALIPANFVLFYLNEGQNLLRVRWHLMGKFPSIEQHKIILTCPTGALG
jgi:hypothetical protein